MRVLWSWQPSFFIGICCGGEIQNMEIKHCGSTAYQYYFSVFMYRILRTGSTFKNRYFDNRVPGQITNLRWPRQVRCREQKGLGQGRTPGARPMLCQRGKSRHHHSSDCRWLFKYEEIQSSATPVRPKQERRLIRML